jgi:hypothetical protein
MDDELERVLEAAFDGGNAAAKKVSDYIDKIMGGIPVWISVEDCLPEKGSAVMGFRSGPPHWASDAYGMAWREIDGDEPGLRWNECGVPTHWMPLPAPPTDSK